MKQFGEMISSHTRASKVRFEDFCAKHGCLFVDMTFPPCPEALGDFEFPVKNAEVQWKRSR